MPVELSGGQQQMEPVTVNVLYPHSLSDSGEENSWNSTLLMEDSSPPPPPPLCSTVADDESVSQLIAEVRCIPHYSCSGDPSH